MFPKICKECAFCLPATGGTDAMRFEHATCSRSAVVLNAVTGEKRHRFCSTERDNPSDTACGSTGRYWQLADYEPDPMNNPGA